MRERIEGKRVGGAPLPPPTEELADPARQAYLEHLEREIEGVIGGEPKDVARAAVLLYDLCRVAGHTQEAAYLERVLDRPALVLFQLFRLLRSIRQVLLDSPGRVARGATVQVDDILRLVLLSLEGGSAPSIVAALLDLRDRLEEAMRTEQTDRLASSVNHLTQHINDYFFDRITALPALREYVVSVELGLPPAMGPS